MALRELWSGGALLLLALVTLVHSTRLDIGSVARPGPGFFPIVLSAALGVVAVALLLTAWSGRHRDRPLGEGVRPASDGPDAEASHRTRPWRLVTTIGALVIYIVVFERLGFILATIGLLALLFGALARYRWPVAIVAGVFVALAAHLVFDAWLQVRLPPGVLSRW
jgi:putative tricarboxylic transport membrane protein